MRNVYLYITHSHLIDHISLRNGDIFSPKELNFCPTYYIYIRIKMFCTWTLFHKSVIAKQKSTHALGGRIYMYGLIKYVVDTIASDRFIENINQYVQYRGNKINNFITTISFISAFCLFHNILTIKILFLVVAILITPPWIR